MELKLEHVTKQYKDKIALDDFSITLTPGIYGILGENGAGKSTLMNLITDNSKRTSGNILLDGKEILHMGAEYRRHIGYMPQQQGEYPNFSALSFLLYMAEAKGIKKKQARKEAEELLELVNLDDVKKKKVNTFSGGMKQRVMLAQALLGGPDILLLDEPTAGLDPKERIRIRNLILKLSKQKIILLGLCQVIIGTFFIFLYNIRFPLHFLNMQLNGHLPSKTRSRLVSTVAVLGSKTPRLPQGCAFSLGSKRLRQVFNVKYRRFQTVFSGNSPSNCFSFL